MSCRKAEKAEAEAPLGSDGVVGVTAAGRRTNHRERERTVEGSKECPALEEESSLE